MTDRGTKRRRISQVVIFDWFCAFATAASIYIAYQLSALALLQMVNIQGMNDTEIADM